MPKRTVSQPPRQAVQVKSTFNHKYLYLIAFIEGGTVMAIELAGARIIAPFFGTSLFVWASVLAVTLGGLAAGYFAGGWATYRYPPLKVLFWELLAGTLLIALMPFLAVKFMSVTGNLGLRLGSLFSSLTFMFLPLFCMGMVSPTIIHLQNKELKGTGKTAGTIYAISTVGGIAMTLLMGFYFLPEWGIRKSVLLSAVLLAAMAILVVILARKFKTESAIGITTLVIIFLASVKSFTFANVPAVKYLYWSEGILGQLTVVDSKTENTRTLYINQIPQTYVNPGKLPVSLWKYPHRLAMIASMKPANSDALLIGLGGGSIAMELKKMGFKVDAVELDRRVPEVAEKFFGFKPDGMNVIIDDGRHFIRNAEKKYDLVIIDVLNGEIQPYHMFTMESFAELKRIMEPDGLLIINNQGFLLDERGLGARSVYRTLLESGFRVKHYFAGDLNNSADIHFVASPSDFHMPFNPPEHINSCCIDFPVDYPSLVLSLEVLATEHKPDLSNTEILTDDKPAFVTMYNYSFEEWRSKTMINLLTNQNTPPVNYFH